MTDTLDSLETRTFEARESELMAGLPQLIARAQGAPGWARILAGVDAAGITSREALARLPVTRKSDLKQLQQGAAAVRRPEHDAEKRTGARVRLARPHFRPRRTRRRLVALCAAHVCGRRARRRPAAELLFVPLHAGRLHGRRRRRAHRLHRDPGRHRPDGNAGAGDGGPETRHLYRHAVIPETDHRKGARNGRRHQQRQTGR